MSNVVVYLSPTFQIYRVPVFEEIHSRLNGNFIVVSLMNPPGNNERVAVTRGNFRRELIRGLHINLNPLSERGQSTPLHLTIAPGLPRLLLRLRPKIVISNNFNLWTLTSILMGYKTVIFWEGTPHTERTVTRWRFLLRKYMASRSKAFVVNGSLSRKYLHEYLGVPGYAIFDGGLCACPPPSRYLRTHRPVPDLPIKFLFVGQMIDRKGVEHLIHAAYITYKRSGNRPLLRVLLVGDGPSRSRYKMLTSKLGLDNIVQFYGWVHPDSIWDYYNESDVFVLPTVQDNWPLVVLEAMSMGLPVVLSKYAGSAPDLIVDNVNGYVFDPHNHESLAGFMLNYIQNPGLVRLHGQGSLRVASRYTPETVADTFTRAISFAESEHKT